MYLFPSRRVLSQLFLLLTSSFCFSQVTPVELGRASNIFSILRPEQNQVYASDSLDLVAFIHRQDVSIHGGGTAESGKLRYDLSTDGGATFTNDIGVLNDMYSLPARYPQITGFNFTNSLNPFDQKLVWDAPTINPLAEWNAPVNGLSDITNSSPVTSTENYFPEPVSTYLGAGLCQGLPGEFWSFDGSYNTSPTMLNDSLYLQKGVFNPMTQDVDWEIYEWIKPPHNLSFDGTPKVASTNIAFSPDGNTGWAAFLGDLVGGPDSTFNPIFIPSTDGGVTWGNPIEVDLSTVDYLSNSDCDPKTIPDVLREYWIDDMGDPVSTGRPTCSFEFDITVDGNGNPHMFVVVGSASTTANPFPAYSLFSGLVKLAIDLYSEDGGMTWTAYKVAPIYAFRSPSFGTAPNTVTMDNHTQISRSPDGSHIFYSWVDSDTTMIGFGNSQNSLPNLRTAALQVSTGLVTCPNWVTRGDLTWNGKALFPTMAPEVLVNEDGSFSLPIVMAEYVTPPNDPVRFWYFGNDAIIENNDFIAEISAFDVDICESQLDEFGYSWEDCNGVCGPVYDWIDITALPGAVQTTGLGDDNAIGPFNIGFDFTYYWTDYNQLKIGSNGWIGFGNTSNISSCFDPLPTPGGQGDNYLAPYLQDLNFGGVGNPGQVWYWSNQADTIIISFINVPIWSANPPGYEGANSFQVILCAQDNSITYQYQDIYGFSNNANCATDLQIGMENITGDIGFQLYNETFPDEMCAIRFNYPDPVNFMVFDAAVEWNQNDLNRVEILDLGTMLALQSNINNVGNQDLTDIMVNADVTNSVTAANLYSSSTSISSLTSGASSLEPFAPDALFDELGNFSFNVNITNAQDINPVNDFNSTEILVIDCLEEVVKLDYNIDNNLDDLNSWTSGTIDNDGFGVYFNPPVHPFRLDSVELIVGKAPNTIDNQNIRIQVLAGDAGPGLGTILAEVDIAGADYPDGIPFTIPVGALEIESGGFYIRWSGEQNAGLGSSNTGPFSNATYEVLNGTWSPFRTQNTEELHVRAYGQCIFPPIPTMGEWGLIILSLLLMTLGILGIRQFSRKPSL
jgi:hypothetical protein